MDDEAAILSAIAAHPEENTPRLAYADWLDDHAAHLPDPDSARIRAELIRVQCEINKYEHLPSTEQQGYVDLYRRQDAILTRHRRDLLGSLGDDLTPLELIFDRGFVTELKLDAERFLKHAGAIAALKPLPAVRVSDVARWLDELSAHSHRLALVSAAHMQSERRPEPSTLSPAEVWSVFVECWPWDRLRSLNLEGCQIGDEGVQRLAGSEALPLLTILDLSGNEISDAGVRLLVNSPLWPRLRYLVLGANPISDDGAFALADAPPTAIQNLNLKRTGIDTAGRNRLLGREGWKVDLF
ncbi:MAG: hypothetical protein JWO38_6360 [Gemmataceae bacterium]|nr:hypothetical protein [Gemmataceae bacterium]